METKEFQDVIRSLIDDLNKVAEYAREHGGQLPDQKPVDPNERSVVPLMTEVVSKIKVKSFDGDTKFPATEGHMSFTFYADDDLRSLVQVLTYFEENANRPTYDLAVEFGPYEDDDAEDEDDRFYFILLEVKKTRDTVLDTILSYLATSDWKSPTKVKSFAESNSYKFVEFTE